MSFWYTPLEYINIAEVYLSAPYLWDAIIYLLIFTGLASAVFQGVKKNPGIYGKRGKPVAIGVGLALTLSMVVFEYNQGFTLGSVQMAVLPLVVLGSILLFIIYRVLSEIMGITSKICAAAVAYIAVYTALFSLFNEVMMRSVSQFPSIYQLITLLSGLSVLAVVVCLFNFIRGLFPEGKSDSGVVGEGSVFDPSTHRGRSPERPQTTKPKPVTPKPTPTPTGPDKVGVRIDTPKGTAEADRDIAFEATVKGAHSYKWVLAIDKQEEASGSGQGTTITSRIKARPPGTKSTIQILIFVDETAVAQDTVDVIFQAGGTGVITGTVTGPDESGITEPKQGVVVALKEEGADAWMDGMATKTDKKGRFLIGNIPFDSQRQIRAIAILDKTSAHPHKGKPVVIDRQNQSADVDIPLKLNMGGLNVRIRIPGDGGCLSSGQKHMAVVEILGASGEVHSQYSLVSKKEGKLAGNDVKGERFKVPLEKNGRPLPLGDYTLSVKSMDNANRGEAQESFCIQKPEITRDNADIIVAPKHKGARSLGTPQGLSTIQFTDLLTNATQLLFFFRAGKNSRTPLPVEFEVFFTLESAKNGKRIEVSASELKHYDLTLHMLYSTTKGMKKMIKAREHGRALVFNHVNAVNGFRAVRLAIGRHMKSESMFQEVAGGGHPSGSRMHIYMLGHVLDENGSRIGVRSGAHMIIDNP